MSDGLEMGKRALNLVHKSGGAANEILAAAVRPVVHRVGRRFNLRLGLHRND